MKTTQIIIICCTIALFASCKSKKEVARNDYTATAIEVGDRTSIVKAWGLGKNVAEAKEDAKRTAVYCILFKGIEASDQVISSDLRPMINNPSIEQEHKAYFDAFFAKNGKYQQFVRFADEEGRLAVGDAIRTANGYKVGVVVVVNKLLLRTELENAGIIKKFGIY